MTMFLRARTAAAENPPDPSASRKARYPFRIVRRGRNLARRGRRAPGRRAEDRRSRAWHSPWPARSGRGARDHVYAGAIGQGRRRRGMSPLTPCSWRRRSAGRAGSAPLGDPGAACRISQPPAVRSTPSASSLTSTSVDIRPSQPGRRKGTEEKAEEIRPLRSWRGRWRPIKERESRCAPRTRGWSSPASTLMVVECRSASAGHRAEIGGLVGEPIRRPSSHSVSRRRLRCRPTGSTAGRGAEPSWRSDCSPHRPGRPALWSPPGEPISTDTPSGVRSSTRSRKPGSAVGDAAAVLADELSSRRE